jgi:SPX domain protein involved in polyphosphate accumulation
MAIEKFLRIEQKYLLTKSNYLQLLKRIKDNIQEDIYHHEKVYNIYFDNDNNDLIINSLNKPIYKEKVRLRSYQVPKANDIVYLELKKKFNGVIYKRRVNLTYKEAILYIDKGIMPNNEQVMQEIDYTFKTYKLKPKLKINYMRDSYIAKTDPSFRITFDYNIYASRDDLKLADINKPNGLINDNYLMEIKTDKTIPLWLLEIINELKIYPINFSKYGEFYKQMKEENNV